MGVDTGENLCYVLNFNTVIDTIVPIVIGLVVEKHGHVSHNWTVGGEQNALRAMPLA